MSPPLSLLRNISALRLFGGPRGRLFPQRSRPHYCLGSASRPTSTDLEIKFEIAILCDIPPFAVACQYRVVVATLRRRTIKRNMIACIVSLRLLTILLPLTSPLRCGCPLAPLQRTTPAPTHSLQKPEVRNASCLRFVSKLALA